MPCCSFGTTSSSSSLVPVPKRLERLPHPRVPHYALPLETGNRPRAYKPALLERCGPVIQELLRCYLYKSLVSMLSTLKREQELSLECRMCRTDLAAAVLGCPWEESASIVARHARGESYPLKILDSFHAGSLNTTLKIVTKRSVITRNEND